MKIKETTYKVCKQDGSRIMRVTLMADALNTEKQLAQARRLREDYSEEKGYVVIKENVRYKEI